MSTALQTLSSTQERTLLDALLSGSVPLPDLAASLNLSLLDLLELIGSPHIQARLAALEQAAAHVIRLRASRHLDVVLQVLADTLEGHRRDLTLLDQRTDPEAVGLRRHERVHARRAATTVLRLTRFSPRGGAPRPPAAPASQATQPSPPTDPALAMPLSRLTLPSASLAPTSPSAPSHTRSCALANTPSTDPPARPAADPRSAGRQPPRSLDRHHALPDRHLERLAPPDHSRAPPPDSARTHPPPCGSRARPAVNPAPCALRE